MRWVLISCFWLFLSACSRPPQPVWTSLPEPEQLLARLQENQSSYRSLDAEASVNLNIRGKSLSSQQFLLLEKPNRVRADVLTGFGQVMLQLTSDGQQLAVFVNTEKPGRFFRGPATDENIARFTNLPLPVETLVRLLLYDPPLVETQQIRVIPQANQLLLVLRNGERRQELQFDHQLRLIGCRYLAAEDLLLEIQYQQIAADGFPRHFSLILAKEETTASLQLSELKINPDLAPEKFVLKNPGNLDAEPLP